MKNHWQLQEAKNKLSQVIDKALTAGPQIITRHGVETAIILSMDEYREHTKKSVPLSDLFAAAPLADLDLRRPRDLPRPGFKP